MKAIARRVCLGILMSMLVAVPTAMAQVTTAVVAGSVKDAQDAFIPGATVSFSEVISYPESLRFFFSYFGGQRWALCPRFGPAA